MAEIATAAAGQALGSGVSFGLSKLFGGKKKSFDGANMAAFSPVGVNYLSSLRNVNAETTQGYDDLSKMVAPGGGRLSQAIGNSFAQARTALGNRRLEAISNLRESLSRRRIAGSSFANDALSRAEAEFQQKENELASQQGEMLARSALQELELQTRMMEGRQNARRQYIKDAVDLEMGDRQLAAQANGILADAAKFNAEQYASGAYERGAAFGPAINAISSKVGGWFSDWLSPSNVAIGAGTGGGTIAQTSMGPRIIGGTT